MLEYNGNHRGSVTGSPTEPEKRKRSPRRIAMMHLENIMSKAGYSSWACHFTRSEVLGMFYIACNQIAAGKKTNPLRVYACLRILFYRVLKGAKFYPNQIHTYWAKAEREIDWEKGKVMEVCPCCGKKVEEPVWEPFDEITLPAVREKFPTLFTAEEENKQ